MIKLMDILTEGKLNEKVQKYVVGLDNGEVISGDKAVSEKKAHQIMTRISDRSDGWVNPFMIGVEAWNGTHPKSKGKPHKANKKKIMVKEGKLTEGSLKQAMQQWKYIEKGLKPKQKKFIQKTLKRLKPKMDKYFKNKDYQDYIDGELSIKVPLPDLMFGKGKEFGQLLSAYSNAIKEPAFYEGKLNESMYAKLGSKVEKFVKQNLGKNKFVTEPSWKVTLTYPKQPGRTHDQWVDSKSAKEAIKISKRMWSGQDIKVTKAVFDDPTWLKIQKAQKTGFTEGKLTEKAGEHGMAFAQWVVVKDSKVKCSTTIQRKKR